MVYTSDNHIVPIEATALTGMEKLGFMIFLRTPGVVYNDDIIFEGWQNYYNGYDRLYKNVYELVRVYGSIQEWDWWIGYWGLT